LLLNPMPNSKLDLTDTVKLDQHFLPEITKRTF